MQDFTQSLHHWAWVEYENLSAVIWKYIEQVEYWLYKALHRVWCKIFTVLSVGMSCISLLISITAVISKERL